MTAFVPLAGAKQTTLESKPERGPGRDPLRPVPGEPPCPRRVPRSQDSALVAWYRSVYAPRAGGAYDSHHRAACIVGRGRRPSVKQARRR